MDGELFSDSYTIHRCDRNLSATGGTTGGGALVATKNNFLSSKLDLSMLHNLVPTIDIVGCKCVFKSLILYILVVYIPPNTSLDMYEILFDSLEQLDCFHNDNVLFLGDFNITQYNNVNFINDRKTQLINNFSLYCEIEQHNRITNVNERLLDLVFFKKECEVLHDNAPLVPEDPHHPALFITLELSEQRFNNFSPNNLHKTYNFSKANFPQLYNSLLGTDWGFLNECSDINLACDKFYNKLYNLFDNHVPLYKNRKHRYPSWYTREIINNIRLKNKYWLKYKKYKRHSDLQEFKQIRSNIKKLTNIAYKKYISDVQESVIHDPKNFWKFYQSKKKKSRIPGNMTYNNVLYNSPDSIVEVFSEYFSSVYLPVENNSNVNTILQTTPNLNLNSNFVITENDIIKAIRKLKNKMTSGPDQIPSFLVKDCAIIIAIPLCILFNLSLKTSQFPDMWKTAKVCPILKSGDPSVVDNYRPISVLCNFAKAFEIILQDNIYLSVKNAITPHQFGFMENRSVTANLGIFTQFVSKTLDNRGQVDVIYTDFSKAFDRIDHLILLDKLSHFDINVTIFMLLRSYIFGRKQFVSYSGYQSTTFIASSGVPQGSNLGPLLFLIFINDLAEEIKSEKLFFADDLKIFLNITSYDDCTSLQNDLDKIHSWCSLNKMDLNASKCKVATFTRKKYPVVFSYVINDVTLARSCSIRDLGVEFDTQLSFTGHITNVRSAAFKALGFIIRNAKLFYNISALIALYNAYVLSKVSYCALIWDPYYDIHKFEIESVQRKFLKFLAFKVDGNYPERGISYSLLLNKFNFVSLEKRRAISSIKFLYNLLHNKIDCPYLLSQINFLVPRQQSRQSLTFYNERARTNVYIKSPIYSMCSNYNKICQYCDINLDSNNSISRVAHTYLL